MKRRDFLSAFAIGAAALRPLAALAQQKPMPVIGFLSSTSREPFLPFLHSFQQGLSETGYVEGQNLTIEYRWADGRYDQLPELTTDLVGRKVSVILAVGDEPARIAKAATSTVPIAFITGADPAASGLVARLSRPGGNLTGVSLMFAELASKRFELLFELVPHAAVIAVLVNPTAPAVAEGVIRDVQIAAHAKGVQALILRATTDAEIEAAFVTVTEAKAGALAVGPDPFFADRREQLVALAARHAVPTLYFVREFAVSGGLISYGSSLTGMWRQVGIHVGKILNGAKPADLPVQQPTKFELVINMNTARALGLTVPPSLLARADEVIE